MLVFDNLSFGQQLHDMAQIPTDFFQNKDIDKLLQNRLRAHWDELVENGRLLPTTDFLSNTGLSREQLSEAVATKRVFAVDIPGHGECYPWFLCDASLSTVAQAVSEKLSGFCGMEKWVFFNDRMHALKNKTPVEALTEGNVEQTLQLAESRTVNWTGATVRQRGGREVFVRNPSSR
jgi:hypothetical protein